MKISKKAKEELKTWGSSDKQDFEVIDIMEELYPDTPTGPDYLCFTAEEDGAKIIVMCNDSSGSARADLKYSTDKNNWTQLEFTRTGAGTSSYSSDVITLGLGEKVYFKGNNPNGLGDDFETAFDISDGKIAASGDIGTLLDEVGGEDFDLSPSGSHTFYMLFNGCTSLTTAPALPATTLAESCYDTMFQNCSSLTSALALPATTLVQDCYYQMFNGCNFPMSNDGTTFNFDFGATLPQTVGPTTFNTHKDVATNMDNINGFII